MDPLVPPVLDVESGELTYQIDEVLERPRVLGVYLRGAHLHGVADRSQLGEAGSEVASEPLARRSGPRAVVQVSDKLEDDLEVAGHETPVRERPDNRGLLGFVWVPELTPPFHLTARAGAAA